MANLLYSSYSRDSYSRDSYSREDIEQRHDDYSSIHWWPMVEQSLYEATAMIEDMLQQIEEVNAERDSGCPDEIGAAPNDRISLRNSISQGGSFVSSSSNSSSNSSSGVSSGASSSSSSGGSGGSSSSSSSSSSGGGAAHRRRLQILGDTSLGNEVVATVVDETVKSEQTKLTILSILKRHFLFSKLHDYDFDDIIGQMQEESAEADEDIIEEGKYGDKFYILEEGECDIIKVDEVVTTIGAGTYFGDLALINNSPRLATIRAKTDCVLWTLDRPFFRQAMLTSNANAGTHLTEFLSRLKLFGASQPFFADLGSDKLMQLAKSLTEKTYEEGVYIIKQGEVGEHFFIVGPKDKLGGGRVHVTETLHPHDCVCGACPEEPRIVLNSDDKGTLFGERALIKKERRARNIVAMERVKVYSLAKDDFNSLLGHKVKEMTDMNEFRMLQAIPIFSKLSPHRLKIVKDLMTAEFCWGGRRIATNSTDICVVMDGQFETSDGQTLRSGDVLGDLQHGAADFAVSLTSLSKKDDPDATVAFVPRAVIIANLAEQASDPVGDAGAGGPHVSEEEARAQKVAQLLVETAARRAESLRCRTEQLSAFSSDLNGLEAVSALGAGTFGNVYLVRHKATGRLMAMKCLDKAAIVTSKQESYIKREASALHVMFHPFIADYYGAIVSPRKVMFMMQFVPGGELWSHLYSNDSLPRGPHGGLPVLQATLYAATIALALEHIHSLGFIYRDLKPENLLFAGNGYLKLVDFGFAMEVPYQNRVKELEYRTYTTCGTPQYMAPEVIRTQGHDKTADLWAFGVLFFELLCGAPPFDDNNQARVFEKVCKGKVAYPPRFDPHCKTFIRQLLHATAGLRLGALQRGFEDIKQHAVFTTRGIDFAALLREEVPMPFVPPPFEAAAATLSDGDGTANHGGDMQLLDFAAEGRGGGGEYQALFEELAGF